MTPNTKIPSPSRYLRLRSCALAVALALLLILTTACGNDESEANTPDLTINLPADEGAHDAGIEWWYFNGHLTDHLNNDYSFHFVTFQVATTQSDGDATQAGQLQQLSFGDHANQVFLTAEKVSLETPAATPGSFAADLTGWRMSGDGQEYGLAFETGGYSVLLNAFSLKPAVLHQETGFVNLGPAGDTFYYTRPRLELSGTMMIDGKPRPVEGTGWMDHQWGEFISRQVGWDWMSLQMEDGSELMAVLVWDPENHQPFASYGTFVAADGTVNHLPDGEIGLTATGSWTSPATNITYPMGWELSVEPLALELVLTPAQREAEYPRSRYGPPSYWEGAVSLTGTIGGAQAEGRGFVELVGYRSE